MVPKLVAHSCVLQVLNYDDFISKPLSKKPEHMSVLNRRDHLQNITVNNAAICGDEPYIEVPIAILSTTVTGIGPQQCEILQVLTCRVIVQTTFCALSFVTHGYKLQWNSDFTFFKRLFKFNVQGKAREMKMIWLFQSEYTLY